MAAKFWETVAGELAKRWTATTASAAAFFWTAGIVAWGVGHEDGFDELEGFLSGVDVAAQVGLAVGAIALVLGSSLLLDLLRPTILRALQGDTSLSWAPIEARRKRFDSKGQKWRRELAKLQEDGLETLDANRARTSVVLDARLHDIPMSRPDLRPTKLGNLMAASDARLRLRYGLDPGVVLPALWLVMPDVARDQLQAARGSVDGAVRTLAWGALLAAWSVWTPWALVAAAVAVTVAYVALLRRAETFGEMTEAAFALYRLDLYDRLGFPRPRSFADESTTGRQLVKFLWRGVPFEPVRENRGQAPT